MAYRLDYAKIDHSQMEVYSESRTRRIFVGTLRWDKIKNQFEFSYDQKYAKSKKAIPIGKELGLFKKTYTSKAKLFPSFADRIPSKENPAYPDYCASQGIAVTEDYPIILLVSIGRRGPSTFVFEPAYKNEFSYLDIKKFREQSGLSIHDFGAAFDLNPPTLQRLESGKKADLGTIRRIEIYLKFPEVAMWQIEMNKGKIHFDKFNKLWKMFENTNAL